MLLRERVENGVMFLERKLGPNWDEGIDLGTLKLCDSGKCVLGQIYREEGKEVDDDGYFYALNHVDGVRSGEMGFSLVGDGYMEMDTPELTWELLDEVWKDVITEKRAG